MTTTAESSSRVVSLALTHSMTMINTNEEKASKIEQKMLITITSTVNVKTVLEERRETIENINGKSTVFIKSH